MCLYEYGESVWVSVLQSVVNVKCTKWFFGSSDAPGLCNFQHDFFSCELHYLWAEVNTMNSSREKRRFAGGLQISLPILCIAMHSPEWKCALAQLLFFFGFCSVFFSVLWIHCQFFAHEHMPSNCLRLLSVSHVCCLKHIQFYDVLQSVARFNFHTMGSFALHFNLLKRFCGTIWPVLRLVHLIWLFKSR